MSLILSTSLFSSPLYSTSVHQPIHTSVRPSVRPFVSHRPFLYVILLSTLSTTSSSLHLNFFQSSFLSSFSFSLRMSPQYAQFHSSVLLSIATRHPSLSHTLARSLPSLATYSPRENFHFFHRRTSRNILLIFVFLPSDLIPLPPSTSVALSLSILFCRRQSPSVSLCLVLHTIRSYKRIKRLMAHHIAPWLDNTR